MQWRSFGSDDQPDPALVEASLDADVENALPIAQPRTPHANVDESVDVVVCVEINQCHRAGVASMAWNAP